MSDRPLQVCIFHQNYIIMEKNASLDNRPLIAKEEKELEEQARIAFRRERCKDKRWCMCNRDAIGTTNFDMQEVHKSNVVK